MLMMLQDMQTACLDAADAARRHNKAKAAMMHLYCTTWAMHWEHGLQSWQHELSQFCVTSQSCGSGSACGMHNYTHNTTIGIVAVSHTWALRRMYWRTCSSVYLRAQHFAHLVRVHQVAVQHKVLSRSLPHCSCTRLHADVPVVSRHCNIPRVYIHTAMQRPFGVQSWSYML